MQRVVHVPFITVTTQVHQVRGRQCMVLTGCHSGHGAVKVSWCVTGGIRHQGGRHQLLLAAGVGHRGDRVFDALCVGGVEAAIHLGHEHGGDAHGVRGTSRALIVAAASDGRQWLVQRLARVIEAKLHQVRCCDRVAAACRYGIQRFA